MEAKEKEEDLAMEEGANKEKNDNDELGKTWKMW